MTASSQGGGAGRNDVVARLDRHRRERLRDRPFMSVLIGPNGFVDWTTWARQIETVPVFVGEAKARSLIVTLLEEINARGALQEAIRHYLDLEADPAPRSDAARFCHFLLGPDGETQPGLGSFFDLFEGDERESSELRLLKALVEIVPRKVFPSPLIRCRFMGASEEDEIGVLARCARAHPWLSMGLWLDRQSWSSLRPRIRDAELAAFLDQGLIDTEEGEGEAMA